MREPQTGMPGLVLPTDVGIGQQAVHAIDSRWDTAGDIDQQLAAMGMVQNKEPPVEWRPITAELLLTPDIKEFTKIFAQQLLWKNYATRLLADIRAHKLQVDNQLNNIAVDKKKAAKVYNSTAAKADRLSVGEIELSIEGDPTYMERKLEQQRVDQMRMKVEAWVEELDSGLKTVSRQIENRRTENEQGKRVSNMPGHAQGRWDNPTRGGP